MVCLYVVWVLLYLITSRFAGDFVSVCVFSGVSGAFCVVLCLSVPAGLG